MGKAVSPLNLNRYELKYLIPSSMVEGISRFIETYCEIDYYSEISPDLFYTINSLYLDSPSLYLMRAKEMTTGYSFNVRIRSYGDGKEPPYFFEVKHKVGEFVKKKRAVTHNKDWLSEVDRPSSDRNLEHFKFIKESYNLHPQILTQYRRKAYLSLVDDYARVTFDRDLRYMECEDWSLIPDESKMCHYDQPEFFGYRGDNVVLELKCEKKIPLWMVDLIRTFELERKSFSKYGNSMATCHSREEVVAVGSLYWPPY